MFKEVFCLFFTLIIGNVSSYSTQPLPDHLLDVSVLKLRQVHHEFTTLDGQYSIVRADVEDEVGLKVKESRKNFLEKNQKRLDENLSALRIYKAIKGNSLPVKGIEDYVFGLFSTYKHQGDKANYIGEISVNACDYPTFYSDGIVTVSCDIDRVGSSGEIEKEAYDCIFQKVLAPNIGKNLPVLRYDKFRLGLIRDMYTIQWCMPISRQPLLGVVTK
jgi:hypothetical protein